MYPVRFRDRLSLAQMFHLPVEVSALWMELVYHRIHCGLSPSGWDFISHIINHASWSWEMHTGPQPVSLEEEKGKIGETVGQLYQTSNNVHSPNFPLEGRIGKK